MTALHWVICHKSNKKCLHVYRNRRIFFYTYESVSKQNLCIYMSQRETLNRIGTLRNVCSEQYVASISKFYIYSNCSISAFYPTIIPCVLLKKYKQILLYLTLKHFLQVLKPIAGGTHCKIHMCICVYISNCACI